jgi:hypothetical protein
MHRLNLSRSVPCVTAAASALALAATVALADEDRPEQVRTESSVAAAGPCAERAFSRVFASYDDNRLYTLAPDGDFEAGAADWTLDGAVVADESSSIQLGAALGTKSLELADGASATTPPICVERGFPNFRFVARSGDYGVLRVQVLYGAGRKSKKTGRIRAAADWKVTRKLSLAQGRLHVRRGRSANVQLTFTASGGTVRMDDVYIDPRLRR